MTTYRTLARLIALCLLLLAASVAAQEVLTNDSVIAMKKAGLSDAVILAKIRSSQSKFDVSTQSLVSLKQAGLSDQVIEAMVGHTGPGGTTLTAPAGPGGGGGEDSGGRVSTGARQRLPLPRRSVHRAGGRRGIDRDQYAVLLDEE